MKSKIQQAAAEYAAQDRVTRSEHVAFVAGVKFAQRWISGKLPKPDVPVPAHSKYGENKIDKI